ncbi:MAG: molybdenum cofactor sulfurase, partial [Caulobacteraceae bacterium]|nr:molybdenum cofactor sulfurase [Caulobacteraceae bacterium]
MTGRIAALYRHPVKGFTPEPLDAVVLTAGAHFPCDRLYTVEDGPSGFDPAHPAHISKMRFAVLAKIPALARARTAYDEASGEFRVEAVGL